MIANANAKLQIPSIAFVLKSSWEMPDNCEINSTTFSNLFILVILFHRVAVFASYFLSLLEQSDRDFLTLYKFHVYHVFSRM